MNAADIKAKLATAGGRAERLAKSDLALERRIEELYRAAYCRDPRADEFKVAVDYLSEPRLDASGKPLDPTTTAIENFQDLIWALINTKEFLFNH
jgi:hypothetical protein